MGKTKYTMCIDALKPHDGEKMTLRELRMLIMIKLASDEKRVNEYLRFMSATNLINEYEHLHWEINIPKDD